MCKGNVFVSQIAIPVLRLVSSNQSQQSILRFSVLVEQSDTELDLCPSLVEQQVLLFGGLGEFLALAASAVASEAFDLASVAFDLASAAYGQV